MFDCIVYLCSSVKKKLANMLSLLMLKQQKKFQSFCLYEAFKLKPFLFELGCELVLYGFFEFFFFFTLALAHKARDRVKRAQEKTSMAMTDLQNSKRKAGNVHVNTDVCHRYNR